MERLVYSPKVWAYIKTDGTRSQDQTTVKTGNGTNTQNSPYYLDLSDYIVSGSVQRVINAVSSGSLTLNNPYRIWTDPTEANAKKLDLNLYKQDWGHPVFHPMDEITIFAARFQNKPIQLFTGYLDSATIFQLYPGTITLQASCTLKRLLYTYWDPALPSIISFLEGTGWEYLPNSGSFANVGKANTQALSQTGGQLNDGSITSLIYKVLNSICNWDDSEILVEALPSNIVSAVVKMYNAISQANELAEAEYNTFLHSMIGTSSAGSSSTPSSSPTAVQNIPSGGAGFSKSYSDLGLSSSSQLNVAGTILGVAYELGQGNNTDLLVAGIYAAMGESTLNSAATNGAYAGAFQALPSDFPDYNSTQGVADQAYSFYSGGKGFQGGGAIIAYNSGITSIPLLASTVEANGNGANGYGGRVSIAQCQQIVAAYNGGNGVTLSSINLTDTPSTTLDEFSKGSSTNSGPSGTMTRIQAMTACANGMSGQYPYELGGGHQALGVPSTATESYSGNVGGPGTKGFDCSGSVSAVLGAAGLLNSPLGSAAIGPYLVAQGYADESSPQAALANTGGVSIFGNSEHTWMMISGRAFGTYDGNTTPIGASWLPAPTLSYAQGFSAYTVKINTLTQNTKYNSPIGQGNSDATGSGTSGNGDIINSKSADAFAISLAVPSSSTMAEALLLSGSKSLMNCVSIFPFIQQLMSAGLRSFCSLPNGSLFAFYPDYFGEFWGSAKGSDQPDTPYWTVDDIEIIDGNIVLSDDPLATHVYVVGDTVWPAWAASSSTTAQLANMIASGGVVTIDNAFETGFVNLSPSGSNQQLKAKINATNFLQRYGARPYINQDANFVSNAYLEAFMAFQTFQLMWARQFQTEFQFTFMPELFPGGRVGFPEHGIQCYIDSVTHQFDYENGFTTSAQLEAPSVLPGATNNGISQGMVRGDLLLSQSSSVGNIDSTSKGNTKGG